MWHSTLLLFLLVHFLFVHDVNGFLEKDKKQESTPSTCEPTDPKTLTPVCPQNTKSTKSSSSSSPPSLTKQQRAIFTQILQLAGEGALSVDASPQHIAMCWLLYDDPVAKKLNAKSYRLRQRYALAVIYQATHGEEWKVGGETWLKKTHECTWFGIKCGWFSKRVQNIELSGNNLQGIIPRDVGLLTDVVTFEMCCNELSGILPLQLEKLTKLQYLKVQFNDLFGGIPEGIGKCVNLREMHLNGNYLLGTLPTTIGALVRLESLDVSSNSLKGTVPEAHMSKMKNLAELILDCNDLEGHIGKPSISPKNASFICNLPKLQVLQADCLESETGEPAELQCECCTVCCHDEAKPPCMDMKTWRKISDSEMQDVS